MFGRRHRERKLREVAENGSALEQCDLGVRFETGNGVGINLAEAAAWYRRSAERGWPDAQFYLARLYALGRGVPTDFVEALRWTERAAGAGFPAAQATLGSIYFEGRGVRRDIFEAVRWYRRAAYQGNIESMFCMGVSYSDGQGIKHDDLQAARWFQRAARKGHAKALNNLRTMHERGRIPANMTHVYGNELIYPPPSTDLPQDWEQFLIELNKLPQVAQVKDEMEWATRELKQLSAGNASGAPSRDLGGSIAENKPGTEVPRLIRRPGNLSLTAWKEYLTWLEGQPVTPAIQVELNLARKIIRDFGQILDRAASDRP